MRYLVTWDPQCFRQIDALIVAGAGFDELKQVVGRLEQVLSEDAPSQGANLSEGLRKLVVARFRIYFHVDETSTNAVVDAIGWGDSPN